MEKGTVSLTEPPHLGNSKEKVYALEFTKVQMNKFLMP